MDGIDVREVITELASAFIMNRDRHERSDNPMFTVNGKPIADQPWDRPLNAQVFFVNIRLTNHGYEKDGNTLHEDWERHYKKDLVVIITERHNVYIGELVRGTEDIRFTDRRTLTQNLDRYDWRNTSNHDSCWRSDGLNPLWNEMMAAYHHCYDHVPEEHRPIPALVGCSATLREGIFGMPFYFCQIEKERHPTQNRRPDENYFTQPKAIRFYTHQVNLIPTWPQDAP